MNLSTAIKNLKKNFILLLSTIAALCLFVSPSLTALLKIFAVFVSAFVIALLDQAKPAVGSNKLARLVAVLTSIFVLFKGYNTFKTVWTLSGKVAALANILHLTTSVLVMLVGAVGCVAGFYAVYILSCCIIGWAGQLIKKILPVQKKTDIIANIKHNWYLPFSATAFFCLTKDNLAGYRMGMLIVFVIMVVVSTQITSTWSIVKKHTKAEKILCLLSAIGIILVNQNQFYAQILKYITKRDWPIIWEKWYLIISYFYVICAIYFVFFCLLMFWKKIKNIVCNVGLLDGVNRKELTVYALIFAVFVCSMAWFFSQTQAFYGTELSYDIIYTGDSPELVKGSVYVSLTHPENDLRQPLFAVFAAPFEGIPYMLGKLFGVSATVQAVMVNTVQIFMIFAANFMLAKIMKLDRIKRVCFMVLTSCTYTQLLFTLMMEQYIVAYFWLIFCIYLISEKYYSDRIVLWGAGGTLLTSMILTPLMSDKHPVRNFKEWFVDMVRYGMEFIVVILAFCRFDVIYNLVYKINRFKTFTGKDLTIVDKCYQYISFISNCLVAPDAGVYNAPAGHISWQLSPVSGINFMGVAIMLLAIISAILNRDKQCSRISAGWVAFSVVMLLGLGWGTKENGLILYALYFGWAFLVLLFQLVEKIENKLNTKFLVPIFSIGCAVVMAVINIPAIMDMVNFAIAYYPV